MEGLLAKDWAIIQHQYHKRQRDRRSGHLWAALLVTKIWELGFAMWMHRNERQNSDMSIQAKELSLCLDSEIRKQYNQGTAGLPQSAQYLFQIDFKQRIQQRISEKQQWLQLVKLERTTVRNQRHRRRLQRHRFERHFLSAGSSFASSVNGGS